MIEQGPVATSDGAFFFWVQREPTKFTPRRTMHESLARNRDGGGQDLRKKSAAQGPRLSGLNRRGCSRRGNSFCHGGRQDRQTERTGQIPSGRRLFPALIHAIFRVQMSRKKVQESELGLSKKRLTGELHCSQNAAQSRTKESRTIWRASAKKQTSITSGKNPKIRIPSTSSRRRRGFFIGGVSLRACSRRTVEIVEEDGHVVTRVKAPIPPDTALDELYAPVRQQRRPRSGIDSPLNLGLMLSARGEYLGRFAFLVTVSILRCTYWGKRPHSRQDLMSFDEQVR